MTQSWRLELREWADRCVTELKNRKGVLGVIMGGSLARGMEWRHSDLETGVLFEERNQALPYFNIMEARGVEVIQLVRRELEEQVKQVEEGGITPLLNWPIQLWEGRIIHDPHGLLGRFKAQFDQKLFTDEVLNLRIADLQKKIDQALSEARGLLANQQPAAALVQTRLAMNDAILAVHWKYGELPRSQNRTDSRLRQLCARHNRPEFYALYREVFDLNDVTKVIHSSWPKVKPQVWEIARLFGDTARDFFEKAVDGDFQWRQNAGILTVYRLYIPVIGAPEHGIFGKLDIPEWAHDNPHMMKFLGFSNARSERVAQLLERLSNIRFAETA